MMKLLFFLVLIIMMGCGYPKKSIGVFFNPGRTFNAEKIHVVVEVGKRIALDTIFQNHHIDKSLFLRRIYFQSNDENMLVIKVNGQLKNINIPSHSQKCTDVFLAYDDHTLIGNAAMEIENKMSVEVDFKQIIDSLKKTSKASRFNEIKVDIQENECP